MARTKCTIRKMSHPPKRAKSAGGMKFASPSSSPPPPSSFSRPVLGLLSPRPTPDEAMHHALTPLLDQGIMQRMSNLGLGPLLTRPLGCGYRYLLLFPTPKPSLLISLLPANSDSLFAFSSSCLRFLCPSRWSSFPVPACPGHTREAGPGAP
ncbi:hypothetical protein LIER_15831 [Lithospermum erythrorhizon]|uniref:Uncharacterized protein n=1 Tax=Lithospermum erythrorhizon TaxID=34254 RepID=A0AAV3Q6V9_LITER